MKLKPSLLQGLKLAQLKHVAVQCGINSSGTKADLTTRLERELPVPRFGSYRPLRKTDEDARKTQNNGVTRLLSIDMGIRNLAYCILDIPKVSPASKYPPSIPAVQAWKRIAVASKQSTPAHAEVSTLEKPEKEAFDPATYASHAYKLLAQTLLPYKPSHILVERQRYRSMGSSAIQEWTVRVNMFEGMLHAVLRTFSEEDRWGGSVHSVSPAKVGSFWLADLDVESVRTAKTAKARNKGAKVDLVGRWLTSSDNVILQSDQAKHTGQTFMDKWLGTGKGRRNMAKGTQDESTKEGPIDAGKLDDLADALLQGVAWVRWEENRVRFLEQGHTGSTF
ncbi:MAG: hypothetical protein M1817_004014 [Caeruleum heppii]|nr:MAG: hypothetical protein M1817_004014 [Caeruleum heppii]